MAVPLDERMAFKVAKLLGKLSSVHDGEALSAVRMAHKIITAQGLIWDDIILGNGKPSRPKPTSLAAEILHLLDYEHLLSEWEKDFLLSVLSWAQSGRPLTFKQENVLNRIKAKVEVMA